MPAQDHVRVRPSHGRKQARFRSAVDEQCRACLGVIPSGKWFVRGLTKEPYHTDCKRLGVRPVVSAPRLVVGSPIPSPRPAECAWCGEPIGESKSITKDQVTYHRPCYLRMRA